MRLVIIMHVQFIARVGQLHNLKAEADWWPVFADGVVGMLQVVVEKFGIVELAKSEVVEHVWRVFILLSQD